MSNCYLGEIRLLPYTRGAPVGWQACDGSLLSIGEYDALYTVLGTTYGGDGQSTFAVPDLRGRVPVHQGTGAGLTPRVAGQLYGTETVTLTNASMPSHFHMVMASTDAATLPDPANNVLAAGILNDGMYTGVLPAGTDKNNFNASAIGLAGGAVGHENMAPTLTLQFCIATSGIYPSQN